MKWPNKLKEIFEMDDWDYLFSQLPLRDIAILAYLVKPLSLEELKVERIVDQIIKS